MHGEELPDGVVASQPRVHHVPEGVADGGQGRLKGVGVLGGEEHIVVQVLAFVGRREGLVGPLGQPDADGRLLEGGRGGGDAVPAAAASGGDAVGPT